ncbi:hypothetical protein CHLRE_08g369000v5 [Chlamydomonas reinhardtii]|uniref:DUF1995 domain-containing protein n=1 Tax=Chlamydomonas reinhardtii TaxID=3055 RepID=A0A2K3DH36_CHLRE|nr:uncharacterized protein CHLRE_08g369000v5 [Chlamydomonas reinhardtii]PNW79845.1 hypothetical protein CHLRE_08g369000v5 [Chlamydomonas reinhardtii]
MKLLQRTPFSCDSSAGRVGRQSIARCPNASRAVHASSLRHQPAASPCSSISHHVARGSVRVAAAAPASNPAPVVVELPDSQQAAVDAAVQCLLPALQPLLVAVKPTKTAKGFSNRAKAGSDTNRFGIEIPVADGSAQAAIDLTTTILNTTAARLKQRPGGASVAAAAGPSNWTVVHAREDALRLATSSARGKAGPQPQVLGLRQACQQPQLAGLLVVVEPQLDDVALVEQLLDEVWAGPAALVINPGWGQQGAAPVPAEYARAVDSISVVYSFLPCAIQGLLGPKEGAVLRTVDAGGGGAAGRPAPWRILLKQKEEFVQVGAMPRRPTSSDLELAYLNASAASSPITKTAKFLRGLIPGKKD